MIAASYIEYAVGGSLLLTAVNTLLLAVAVYVAWRDRKAAQEYLDMTKTYARLVQRTNQELKQQVVETMDRIVKDLSPRQVSTTEQTLPTNPVPCAGVVSRPGAG